MKSQQNAPTIREIEKRTVELRRAKTIDQKITAINALTLALSVAVTNLAKS